MDTTSFNFPTDTRVGPGVISQLNETLLALGIQRPLVVTDSGLLATDAFKKLAGALLPGEPDRDWFLHSDVQPNPTEANTRGAAELALAKGCDGVVGLGGGSALDAAKVCRILIKQPQLKLADYDWEADWSGLLPFIAIPTTAGTGSECQSFALISDTKTHQKMACGDPKAAAKIAILDPELTLSQQRNVTACTGIDAIAHAVETSVTKKKNELSWMFSKEAFELLLPHFQTVLNQPDDLNARGSMLLGAAMAGCAIEASMLGAAHSTANPLTAHYDIVHGQAVGMMLPHVVRFNAGLEECRQAYGELARIGKLGQAAMSDEAVDSLAKRLTKLLEQADMPVTLRASGVEESMLTTLAAEAAGQWTASFNPREVGQAEMESIYRAAF